MPSYENLFDMNAYRVRKEVHSKSRIMFSITLGWFYGPIVFLIVIYVVVLIFITKRRMLKW